MSVHTAKGEGGCGARPAMNLMLDSAPSSSELLACPPFTVEQLPEQAAQLRRRAGQRRLDVQAAARVADIIEQLEAVHEQRKQWLPMDGAASAQQRTEQLSQLDERAQALRRQLVAAGGWKALPWSAEYARQQLQELVELIERDEERARQYDSDEFAAQLAEQWRVWDNRRPQLRADGSGRPGWYRIFDEHSGRPLSLSLSAAEVRRRHPQLAAHLRPDSSD